MAKRLIPPPLNRALIQKIVSPSKTSMLNSGKVVAVGPGSHDREGKLIAVSVKEGDTVLLPEYGGTEIKLGEKDPTSHRRRRAARSSVNYVVMQYLLCTKNKMPFDPILVLKHFNAPVAEPCTVAPFL